MDDDTAVSVDLLLRLVAADRTVVPVPASFGYSVRDPYAVHVAFHVGVNEPVAWVFARDLLAAGLVSPAGLGDVRIWPVSATDPAAWTGVDAGAVVLIELSSPFGEARFEASRTDLAEFLQRTYDVVPRGGEGAAVDLDAELAELLAQS